MSWFSQPKCPNCGGKLIIVSRPLMDAYRCDNCVERNEGKKKLKDLETQIDELRRQLKGKK
jgi:tRNA(Ile2) C34 agmatinyltransferase TiaS